MRAVLQRQHGVAIRYYCTALHSPCNHGLCSRTMVAWVHTDIKLLRDVRDADFGLSNEEPQKPMQMAM